MKLHVHPEARPWMPTPQQRELLERNYPGSSYVVYLWPRSMLEGVMGEPSAPWAYRAKAFQTGESHVFVDWTETRESIAWLIAHELTHQVVFRDPELLARLSVGRPVGLDPASDRFHAIDPHEIWCDDAATWIFGVRYDRSWWRTRTPAPASRVARYGAMPFRRYRTW